MENKKTGYWFIPKKKNSTGVATGLRTRLFKSTGLAFMLTFATIGTLSAKSLKKISGPFSNPNVWAALSASQQKTILLEYVNFLVKTEELEQSDKHAAFKGKNDPIASKRLVGVSTLLSILRLGQNAALAAGPDPILLDSVVNAIKKYCPHAGYSIPVLPNKAGQYPSCASLTQKQYEDVHTVLISELNSYFGPDENSDEEIKKGMDAIRSGFHKCSVSKQVECNPLLFGPGVCVPFSKTNMTSSCFKQICDFGSDGTCTPKKAWSDSVDGILSLYGRQKVKQKDKTKLLEGKALVLLRQDYEAICGKQRKLSETSKLCSNFKIVFDKIASTAEDKASMFGGNNDEIKENSTEIRTINDKLRVSDLGDAKKCCVPRPDIKQLGNSIPIECDGKIYTIDNVVGTKFISAEADFLDDRNKLKTNDCEVKGRKFEGNEVDVIPSLLLRKNYLFEKSGKIRTKKPELPGEHKPYFQIKEDQRSLYKKLSLENKCLGEVEAVRFPSSVCFDARTAVLRNTESEIVSLVLKCQYRKSTQALIKSDIGSCSKISGMKSKPVCWTQLYCLGSPKKVDQVPNYFVSDVFCGAVDDECPEKAIDCYNSYTSSNELPAALKGFDFVDDSNQKVPGGGDVAN